MGMPMPNDETTTQLQGDDPIPSGAASPPPAPAPAPAPAADPDSAKFYDSVLALPEDQREKVIDEMHPEDLKGFLAHTAERPQTGQTEPPARVPYAAGIRAPADGEAVTEVPLTKPDGAPAIGHLDRALAQNFANDPDGQAAYYRKNYPGLDFGVFSAPGRQVDPESAAAMNDPAAGKYAGMGVAPQQTGAGAPTDRVYVRPKGSKVWSAVDPDTGFQPLADPKEALQDLGDSAYKLGSGVPIAAATAAGGLAGAPTGLGALPGAMAAGAAASGISEGVRQGVGAALGMNKSADYGQLGDALAAGAATPLIFGTGASPAAAAAKGVDYATQRGLVGRTVDKVIPGLSSWISGIPANDIRFARDNLPEIKATEKGGQAAVDAKVRSAMDGVREGLMSMQGEAWNEISNAIDRTSTPVDLSAAKDHMQGAIAALEKRPMLTAGEKEQLAALKSEYDRAFFQQPQGALRAQIQSEAQANAANVTALEAHLGEHPELGASLDAMKQRQAQLQEALTRGIEVPDQVGAKDALRIRAMLKDTANFVHRSSGDPYGNLTDAEKAVQLTGSGAYKATNDALDTAVAQAGTSYKGLNQRYKQVKDLEEVLRPFMGNSLKDEDRSAKILRNLGAKSNAATRSRLQQLDQQRPGHDIIHNADLLNAMTTFSNPSSGALNGYGSTSTTKTTNAANIFGGLGGAAGGLAGFFASGGADGNIVHALEGGGVGGSAGYAAGRGLGPVVASPSALRKYMQLGRWARAGGAPVRATGQIISPWALEQIKKEYGNAQGQ